MLRDLNAGLIPNHEFMNMWLAIRFDDLDVVAEDASFDANLDVLHFTAAQYDAVLDFCVPNDGSVTNGRERADIAILDHEILPDDRGPSHNTIDD